MAALLDRLYDPRHIMRKKNIGDEELPSRREATSNLLRLAWPSILEAMLISLISLVDTAMVGTVGSEAIAAVGLSGQPRFIILAVFISLNTGVTAVVARRRGEGDRERANRTLRQALLVSAVLSIVLSVVGIVFARDVLLFVGAQADTIDMATTYTQILIGGIFFNVMSLTINAAQRGAGNTRISMRTNMCANIINVIFNYLLIGGNFGFPKLGVAGAAIATVIGYLVAFVMSWMSVRHDDLFLHVNFKESFRPDRETMAPLIQVGSSAAVEQVFMRVGFFIFAKMVASLGTAAFATHQICLNLLHQAFAFGDGLGIATASLVGQNLGRRKPANAQMSGLLSQRIGLSIGSLIILAFIFLRHLMFVPFTTDTEIIFLGGEVALILAAIVPAQISQVIFSTCLRTAGDTRYTAIVSLISITIVRIVSTYFFCFVLDLGLIGAWLGFATDQYTRLLLHGLRFARGKWTSIKL